MDFDRAGAKAAGYTDAEIDAFLKNPAVDTRPPLYDPERAVRENTPLPFEVTQTYGQPSEYDVFSGGINTGVDFASPSDTPVSLPDDDWTIEDAFNGATSGYIGNGENQGYGNSVMVKNNRTGEKLRLNHLNAVGVTPGQSTRGGIIGLSGSTGNVTGPHLDVEYYDPEGNMGDVLQTPYRNLFPAAKR